MIKVKELLPIGSIVLLKEGVKRLMINGVMQNDANGNGANYDYLGILYPEGHIGEMFQYLFNHEDIDQIVFRGYEDDERKEFLDKLEKMVALDEELTAKKKAVQAAKKEKTEPVEVEPQAEAKSQKAIADDIF